MRKVKKSLAAQNFCALFRAPWSCRKIAKAIGCGKTTVAGWMTSSGLTSLGAPSPETHAALWKLVGLGEPASKWSKREAAKLSGACKPRFTRRGMAKLLKRSLPSIRNYAQGRQLPSLGIACRIEELAPDVRTEDWGK